MGSAARATGRVDAEPSADACAARLSARAAAGTGSVRGYVVGSGYRLDADDLVVSYVRSGAQLVELSRRAPRPVTEDPVFLVNPRGDREAQALDALVLRRMVYPRSVGLGRVLEDVHGTGTPDELLDHLGASMLHLGCGIRSTPRPAVELVDGQVLDLAAITARLRSRFDSDRGGLVVLPPDVMYHSPDPLPEVLLSCGFTGVVGWHWPVPQPVASLMVYLLHTRLVDDKATPADAVHAVRRWMRDPHRAPVPGLPSAYAAILDRADLVEPRHWASLCHWGR